MDPAVTGRPRIEVHPDPQGLARRAAEIFAADARSCIERRGRFAAALAGGSTPRLAHRALAELSEADPLPWDRIHLFWGDERLVPADHPRSNFRMARETLLDLVPIPETNVHRVPTERATAREAAAGYEEALRSFFGLEGPSIPPFDLIFLGLGGDGHTASLFPGSTLLAERTRLVAAGRVEGMDEERLSLTLPVLDAAARIVFMATGSGKSGVVREVLEGGGDARRRLPAAMISPLNGEITWLLDAAAAAELRRA